jgi:gamma-glutamyltranspeptidase/glutathione hydrolase
MAPTVILRGERPEVVVGAAGGPRIISATLQVILNVIDFHMPVKEAVIAPRIHHQWMPDSLIVEADIGTDTKRALERRGHNVRERGVVGVAQAIIMDKGKISGAADPRKPARAASE